MIIIDGKKISKEILAEVKSEVEKLSFSPVFCDILVGGDLVSKKYVEMKARMAEQVGMRFHEANFDSSISTDELVEEIQKLNQLENICGIIVQLPLPESIDKRRVLDVIDPKLDVDCLGKENSARFYQDEGGLVFPTALACIHILYSMDLDLQNKKIVVLGQGELVGRPVSALLRFGGLDPICLDSKSENREAILKEADVIISGIGKEHYLKGGMLKHGVILIDAGTSESAGSIKGDVDLASVESVASMVSPVPGGVGPVTVAMLFRNVLEVAKHKDE